MVKLSHACLKGILPWLRSTEVVGFVLNELSAVSDSLAREYGGGGIVGSV